MITYKTHPETEESKNVFIELNGEMHAGEFRTIKELKQTVINLTI